LKLIREVEDFPLKSSLAILLAISVDFILYVFSFISLRYFFINSIRMPGFNLPFALLSNLFTVIVFLCVTSLRLFQTRRRLFQSCNSLVFNSFLSASDIFYISPLYKRAHVARVTQSLFLIL